MLRSDGHLLAPASSPSPALVALPRAAEDAFEGVDLLVRGLASGARGVGGLRERGVSELLPHRHRPRGLFADEASREAAQRLSGRVSNTADEVAEACIRGFEEEKRHIVPMTDARWSWRIKRASPAVFAHVAHLIDRVFVTE